MAYRFVLEVPESLAQEVNTAIGTVPDAQVHHIRNSHGLGFDDPYVNLSVAAHTLTAVERVYQWMLDYGEPWPDVRLVMHDGRRVSFAKANVSLVTAAIRRDQPWVDHTMPQIGLHEPKPWLTGAVIEAMPEVTTMDLFDPASLQQRFESAPRIPVHNLAPAEQYYDEVLDLHVVARARRREDSTFEVIEGHYDPKLARLREEEADAVFLENGPLQINLERFPRGYPLPYGTDPLHIHTTATRGHIADVKGRILVYGNNLLESSDDVLRFLDPYNVIWTLSPAVAIEDATPAALQG